MVNAGIFRQAGREREKGREERGEGGSMRVEEEGKKGDGDGERE